MPANNRNLIAQTVTNTPGTGDFVLGAAAADFLALGAGDNGLSFNCTFTEAGLGQEVRTGCVYTHSGTALTRGTLEKSTTGAAISFTSDVMMSVTLPASVIDRLEGQSLPSITISPTTADITATVNTFHYADLSGLTAARSFVLPTTFAVDDKIVLYITATHATAGRELLITAGSGDTLRGVAGGTEWSRVWQVGETIVFRGIVANTTWGVEYDGRIPQLGSMSLTGSDITTSSTGWTGVDLDTADVQRGCIVDVAVAGASLITWRRSSSLHVSGIHSAKTGATVTDNEFSGWGCSYGGIPGVGTQVFGALTNNSGTTARGFPAGGISYARAPAGSQLQLSRYTATTANIGSRALNTATYLALLEILDY